MIDDDNFPEWLFGKIGEPGYKPEWYLVAWCRFIQHAPPLLGLLALALGFFIWCVYHEFRDLLTKARTG